MRALFVDDPVDVVSSSGVGLLAPGHFIRLIVLLVSPRVISLGVWADVGSTVAHWIDSLLSK